MSAIFQFHKGTIKTDVRIASEQERTNFNSIKVRLKQAREAATTFKIVEFQFHKGTIKTMLRHSKEVLDSNFNSIKVRLKLLRPIRQLPTFFISIP